MSDRLIAPWSQSKYLIGSSLLFLGPSLYAYSLNQKTISIMTLATSLASINFWRRADYTWRRDCDLVTARGYAVMMTYYGFKSITTIRESVICYPPLVLYFYCYYKSQEFFNKKNDKWLLYHIASHITITYEQYTVIYIINESHLSHIHDKLGVIISIVLIIIYFIEFYNFHCKCGSYIIFSL
jgi:hypothetical protein